MSNKFNLLILFILINRIKKHSTNPMHHAWAPSGAYCTTDADWRRSVLLPLNHLDTHGN